MTIRTISIIIISLCLIPSVCATSRRAIVHESKGRGGIVLEDGRVVGPPCKIAPSGLHVCLNEELGEGGRSYMSKDGYEVYVVERRLWE